MAKTHLQWRNTPHCIFSGMKKCSIKTRDLGNRETDREKTEFQNINEEKQDYSVAAVTDRNTIQLKK